MTKHYEDAFGEFSRVLPERGCPRFDGFVGEFLQLCPDTASDQMIIGAMEKHFAATGTSNIREAVQMAKIVYGDDVTAIEL